MARLRHAGHEGSALDGVSPAASRLGRVTLERPKVTKGLLPRLFARLTSGTFGSSSCPTARADGPSMAQRRSLGVLPRGLDKRIRLSE